MFPSSYVPLYTVFFLHGYIPPEPEITTHYGSDQVSMRGRANSGTYRYPE